ncbi:MAG TPA: hypothetical protein VK937_12605 [Candidatus Limnocylindria bacterium]|nr:hypothetical protein [Candidatus Limnocylindria bacterium]
MRVARFVLCFFFILASSPRLRSQSTPTPQRDPQALVILQRCLSAGGGAQAFSTIQDFLASGTITYHWAGQDVVGTVTAQGKGLTEFRLDSVLPEGTRSFKVVGTAGSITTEDRKISALPYSGLMTAPNLTFPGARVASALNNSAIALQFLGLVPFESAQAYQIRVSPPLDSSLTPPSGATQFGSFDIYVDPTTYQILELSESIWVANSIQSLPHAIRYSNYRPAGSVVAPYQISELVNGQETWSISLSSISLNNSLSDSIFKP